MFKLPGIPDRVRDDLENNYSKPVINSIFILNAHARLRWAPFPLLIGIGLLFCLLAGGAFTALAQGRAADFARIDDVLKGITPSPRTYDFTINRFFSDIVIEEDSSVTVKETIEVEFHRPRHGIYRDIPYRYRNDLGKPLETPIRILSVTQSRPGFLEA